ncbi:hypothetical protein [Flavisphingomonas formosensis]|uniref:hypothetical protein n=1 Tax=Flavisphingomonas formosensis TaxID=861534 RepID=UPI0012FCB0FC|nr:hypothetical protein [Sphingomonas formosensis]
MSLARLIGCIAVAATLVALATLSPRTKPPIPAVRALPVLEDQQTMRPEAGALKRASFGMSRSRP